MSYKTRILIRGDATVPVFADSFPSLAFYLLYRVSIASDLLPILGYRYRAAGG